MIIKEYIFDTDNEDLIKELEHHRELVRRLKVSKVYHLRGDNPAKHPDFNINNVSDNTVVSFLQEINDKFEEMLSEIHKEVSNG